MCFCCATKDDVWAFKESILGGQTDEASVKNALGMAIINISENFTTVIQPMLIDLELVYGITSFGCDELMFIREEDDLPLYESNEFNVDLLPVGFRKALAVEIAIHRENVKKYGLESVDPNTQMYYPKNPAEVNARRLLTERLTQTSLGRIGIRILCIYDKIAGFLIDMLRRFETGRWIGRLY